MLQAEGVVSDPARYTLDSPSFGIGVSRLNGGGHEKWMGFCEDILSKEASVDEEEISIVFI